MRTIFNAVDIVESIIVVGFLMVICLMSTHPEIIQSLIKAVSVLQ